MYELCRALVPIFFLLSVGCDSLTVRQTENGPVEGVQKATSLGQKYYSFRGIPYAEAPITGKDPFSGEEVDRRFKAPEPLRRKWTQHLKAFEFGDCCIPSSYFLPVSEQKSENCLYLNIYVPDGGAAAKPVIIYIHGGAFMEGQGNDMVYGPDFLLSQDNVVITMNYRIGIFGFLNLGFGDYTGNMGLKDQKVAIKWIYDNVENFAGNKSAILLMGSSAGAVSVNLQMLNEESRKNFNRAYIMSSSALNYVFLNESNHLSRMQDFSGIKDDQSKLIEYLKTTNSSRLAECHMTRDFGKTLHFPWVPTVEPASSPNAFLTKHPEEIYKSNNAPAMDALFGFTNKEFIMFAFEYFTLGQPYLSDWNTSELEIPCRGFERSKYPNEYKRAFELLKKAYYPDTVHEEAIKEGNINLLSDLNFNFGILKTLALQAEANQGQNKGAYLWRFSVNADLNFFKALNDVEFEGATHNGELCYIFYCHIFDDTDFYVPYLKGKNGESSLCHDIVIRMTKMITNFARTGNPSIAGDTPFKSCTPTDFFCQDINNEPKSTCLTDIKKQLHYDTWVEIEKIYKTLKEP